MTQDLVELHVQLELPDADADELERLGRRLRADLLEMDGVQTVDPVSAGPAPDGTKAVDWNLLGEWAVKLSAAAIPTLLTWLKARTERAPANAPLKLKVKVGRRSAEVEYNPATMTPEQVAALVESLKRSLAK